MSGRRVTRCFGFARLLPSGLRRKRRCGRRKPNPAEPEVCQIYAKYMPNIVLRPIVRWFASESAAFFSRCYSRLPFPVQRESSAIQLSDATITRRFLLISGFAKVDWKSSFCVMELSSITRQQTVYFRVKHRRGAYIVHYVVLTCINISGAWATLRDIYNIIHLCHVPMFPICFGSHIL
jgi:hypothetical protein